MITLILRYFQFFRYFTCNEHVLTRGTVSITSIGVITVCCWHKVWLTGCTPWERWVCLPVVRCPAGWPVSAPPRGWCPDCRHSTGWPCCPSLHQPGPSESLQGSSWQIGCTQSSTLLWKYRRTGNVCLHLSFVFLLAGGMLLLVLLVFPTSDSRLFNFFGFFGFSFRPLGAEESKERKIRKTSN